jgi:hypothetical protein
VALTPARQSRQDNDKRGEERRNKISISNVTRASIDQSKVVFNVSSTYLDGIWDVFRVLDGDVLRDLRVTQKVKKKFALSRKLDISAKRFKLTSYGTGMPL